MRTYRVSIWTTYEVEANNEEEAIDKARDAVAGQEIRNRDYEVEIMEECE